MLSIDYVRQFPDLVRKAITDKGDQADIDRVLSLDKTRRAFLKDLEQLQAERNQGSKQVGRLMGQDPQKAGELKDKMKGLGQQIQDIEKQLTPVSDELNSLMLLFPNVPDEKVPPGKGEDDNVEVSSWGQKPEFSFVPRPHWELGEELGVLDLKRAVKISGSGFVVAKAGLARLERGLAAYMLDLAGQAGYTEVSVPFLANREAMTGTGQLPKLEDDMYHLDCEDLFLIPTAEVPVTNLHSGEILSADQLPLKYCCHSACFRREAGSHGKDTRGMVRVHQFNKVELVKITSAESSSEEHQLLLGDAERVLQGLGLHYRVLELCRGDLSFAAARCYDIEVWAPGLDKYLEVSSVSNFCDFQARRSAIRYRASKGKPQVAHTLNGSATALPRLLVALLETCQQDDGSIKLPEVLGPYLGGENTISK
jgi:seryl-tRNA synthetase